MAERLNLVVAVVSGEVASGEIDEDDGKRILSGIDRGFKLPQGPEIWPTKGRLREIEATQPDPRDVVRELRKKIRPASAKTLGMRLD